MKSQSQEICSLQTGKTARNSVYSGNGMNSAATFLYCRRDKFDLQKAESKKDSRFGFKIISTD